MLFIWNNAQLVNVVGARAIDRLEALLASISGVLNISDNINLSAMINQAVFHS